MRDFVAKCQAEAPGNRAEARDLIMHPLLDSMHASGSSARITGEGLFRTASMLAVV